MISGEFDLSIGSMIGFSSMAMTLLTVQAHFSMTSAALLTLLIVIFFGFLNGLIVVRTGLPSFIITLGSLFIIRGITIGFSKFLTGRTQLGGLETANGYNIMS